MWAESWNDETTGRGSGPSIADAVARAESAPLEELPTLWRQVDDGPRPTTRSEIRARLDEMTDDELESGWEAIDRGL